MKKFLTNLNKWIRKIHRWMVIPVVIILVINILSVGTTANKPIQRVQQASVMFMVVTGVYLYLYREWSKLQRKNRAQKNE